jgi:hypothetical protein
MNQYSADYCRAVLTADERWRLSHLIAGIRKWSLFGVDFQTLRECWEHPFMRPILTEEIADETLRDFSDSWPWEDSGCDRPEVRKAILELWEVLTLNNPEARLQFFIENAERRTEVVRLASAAKAFERGQPEDSHLPLVRLNPWFRSIICEYASRKQALEAQQAATVG